MYIRVAPQAKIPGIKDHSRIIRFSGTISLPRLFYYSTFASYRSSGVTGVTGVQTILPTPVN
jgi:hypothetical protein